jgi:predicted dehydrogenase
MTSKINVALLGGGNNSAVGSVHKVALEMDKRFRIHAGCFSRNPDVNQSTAEQYDVDNFYTSIDELLMKEANHLDAIVILTPTPQHKDHVIQCLEANLPVICEKALATSSHEAMEIQKALHQEKRFLAVTFNYTGYPMLRELKDLIERGQLGKIEQLHIEMPQEGFSRLNAEGDPIIPQDWRLRDGSLPTISLDLGVHIHHLIDYLTGEKPEEVMAVQNSFGSFKNIIDNVACIAKYSNDVLCNIWFSKVALGHRNGLKVRVYGTKGAAEWMQMTPEELLLSDNKGRRTILDRANVDANITTQARYNRFKAGHPAGFIEAFANHYFDIADALESFQHSGIQPNHEHVFGLEKAKEGLIMLEAISTAAVNKEWTTVNL